MKYDQFAQLLDRPKLSDNKITARCPAHDDNDPSLSVSEGDDGRVLVKCHAGCDIDSILRAMQLEPSDLFDQAKTNGDRPKIVSRYPYTDADGDLLFEVVRMVPKTFRQRQPDGNGGWTWNTKGIDSKPLWRLPEVIAAVAHDTNHVWITEGEKDAKALQQLLPAGQVATTIPGGAGKWRPEHTDTLKGANVMIVQDNDLPGRQHAWEVHDALADAGCSVDVLEPIGGKDAAEAIANGTHWADWPEATRPEAQAEVSQGSPPGGTEPDLSEGASGPGATEPDTLRIEDVAVVAARVDAKPPRKYLARPIIIAGSHGGFAAEDTSGKSWATMDLAVNTAAGGAWLGQYPIDSPGPVLMFVGEEDEDEWVRRGRAVAEHYGYDFDALPIRLCQRVPKFTNEAHVNAVRWELDQHPTQLVVIDPLYLGFAGVQTGQLAEVGDALGHVQRACRDHGATLWLTHHWNKTGHGTGRERASGAGFKEWARTIASVAVKSRATDGAASVVTLDWEFVGNNIVDSKLRTRRKVYADDPDDLGSLLHYELEILDFDDEEDPDGLSPAQRRTLNAVFVASEETGSASVKATQTATKDDGTDMPPLKLSTVQHALPDLFALELVDRDEPGAGKAVSWWPTRGPDE